MILHAKHKPAEKPRPPRDGTRSSRPVGKPAAPPAGKRRPNEPLFESLRGELGL